MSKQVYVGGNWYDITYIQPEGIADRFVVVYQYDGRPRTLRAHIKLIRDKPAEPTENEIDWEKPLQIKCGDQYYDVIFHKRYGDVISLIFEKWGEPVFVHENIDDLSIRDITIRNKPSTLTFERWLVHSRDGVVHTCHTEVEAQKRLLHFKNGGHFIKHIKVEWEL